MIGLIVLRKLKRLPLRTVLSITTFTFFALEVDRSEIPPRSDGMPYTFRSSLVSLRSIYSHWSDNAGQFLSLTRPKNSRKRTCKGLVDQCAFRAGRAIFVQRLTQSSQLTVVWSQSPGSRGFHRIHRLPRDGLVETKTQTNRGSRAR